MNPLPQTPKMNRIMRYTDSFLMVKDGGIHSYCPTRQVSADLIRSVYGLPVELHHLCGCSIVVPVDSFQQAAPMVLVLN